MADPAQAKPDPEALRLLSELSRIVYRTAVISGRDSAFLARQLPIDGLLLIGNHGLEERVDGRSRLAPEALPYASALESAARAVDARPEMQARGVIIERKQSTIAVHYRQADDPSSAAAALESPLERIATANQLELRPGRLVFELRPPVPLDKGAVLLSLVDRMKPERVLVAGDDRTDLDAFRALPAIRASGVRAISVAVRSQELPEETFAACDLVVDGVGGMVALLRALRAAFSA